MSNVAFKETVECDFYLNNTSVYKENEEAAHKVNTPENSLGMP